jgi:hypothetical protein
MTLTELLDTLMGFNSKLEADIMAKGGTPVTYGQAEFVAIALFGLLLWWVIVRKPGGALSFIFGSFLWGLLIVEGFIWAFGIPGKLEEQLTVQFLLLCWVVGFVFQRIEWRIIDGVTK